MMADFYKESHQTFKKNYEGAAKRPTSAIKDKVQIKNRTVLWVSDKTSRLRENKTSVASPFFSSDLRRTASTRDAKVDEGNWVQ